MAQRDQCVVLRVPSGEEHATATGGALRCCHQRARLVEQRGDGLAQRRHGRVDLRRCSQRRQQCGLRAVPPLRVDDEPRLCYDASGRCRGRLVDLLRRLRADAGHRHQPLGTTRPDVRDGPETTVDGLLEPCSAPGRALEAEQRDGAECSVDPLRREDEGLLTSPLPQLRRQGLELRGPTHEVLDLREDPLGAVTHHRLRGGRVLRRHAEPPVVQCVSTGWACLPAVAVSWTSLATTPNAGSGRRGAGLGPAKLWGQALRPAPRADGSRWRGPAIRCG